ncbi:MAG: hypothetical protein ABR557_13865 [Pyrinomonadaceae bacterium]
MKKSRYRNLLRALALIAVVGVLWSALASASQTTSSRAFSLKSAASLVRSVFASTASSVSSHNLTLSKARVSTLADNRKVIVMVTGGDLPGVLTLAVEVNSDGTISGGEWALVSTEADQANGSDTDPGDAMVMQKGVLKGLVSGGTVSLDADGTLVAVNTVQLAVNGGTLVFDGIASGDGIANGANLDDSDASSGSMTLNF